MKLIDYTKILRSKNAGPLYITFDLIFNNKCTYLFQEDRLCLQKGHMAFPITKYPVLLMKMTNISILSSRELWIANCIKKRSPLYPQCLQVQKIF